MPKAILEFDLTEESDDHYDAINGMKWHLIVSEMDDILRNYLKYGHEFKDIDSALDNLRERLRDVIYEHGLTLE